jgi:ankyrin repeat protein
MLIFRPPFILFLITCLALPFLAVSAQSAPVSQTLHRVPTDSILVVSIDGQKMISKSDILQNQRWNHLFKRLEEAGFPLRSWLSDHNSSGIKWSEPVQFFVRLVEGENPHPQFGAIARASSPELADRAMLDIARSLGLRPSKNNPKIYQRTTQPFAIGREGEFCFLLGNLLLQKTANSPARNQDLEKFISSLSSSFQPPEMPAPLARHASHSSDLAIYLEGTGNGRMVEAWHGNPIIESILPLFDSLLLDSYGIFFRSQPGSLKIDVHNYSNDKTSPAKQVNALKIADQLPGDAPLVGRISLPEEGFHHFLGEAVDMALKLFSANKLGADTDLPGFDLSARELVRFPSGDFVFAGGSSHTGQTSLPNGQPITQTRPIWAAGMKISNPLAFRELLAGMNAGMGLNALLQVHQLELIKGTDTAWLSTPEYSRELKLGTTIEPLAFHRRKLLNNHAFALDFNPTASAKLLREPQGLSFDQLKYISWLDEFSNFNLRSNNQGGLSGKLKLSTADRQPWSLMIDRVGQEWIDQINTRLFLAIARDDLNEVVEAVAMGALINANDRFGHSPLHYAAYRGNAYIVDYLLRNGGDPNTRGNHLSTPLHSAAWGKNQEVVELLLEDGAEVDAQTDEQETPVMTATLRGQIETVETLLALSADVHAVDAYGSNLMDLAGASGNIKIVELLKGLGVKSSYPLHLAAGTGDFNQIRSLLKAGRLINEQDSFGATPLLVATVAGREDVVDYLLDRSADPTIEAKNGYTLLHGAAFSGKKSLIRKMLAFGLDLNRRYGPDAITPTDVGEEGSEGLIYLRSMGGRSSWELGPE